MRGYDAQSPAGAGQELHRLGDAALYAGGGRRPLGGYFGLPTLTNQASHGQGVDDQSWSKLGYKINTRGV